VRARLAGAGAVAVLAITGGVAAGAAPASVVVRPGTVIVHSGSMCTVAFTGMREDGVGLAFTAGHCRGQDPDEPVFTDTYQPIGHFAAALAEGAGAVTDGDATGFGVIELFPGVTVSSVNDRYHLVLQGQRAVVPGDHICHIGARTGLACGVVTTVNATAISAAMATGHGDSGGPAFVPTGPHTFAIIGDVVAELDDGQTTVIDPIARFLADARAGYGPDWAPIATLPTAQ